MRRKELWTTEEGWPTFRFPTDDGFFGFVEEACGWDLPAPDAMAADAMDCP